MTNRRNKYKVAPVPERTWLGTTYASKGEMEVARQLRAMLDGGHLIELAEQSEVVLDPKGAFKTVVDFRTVKQDGSTEYVEVKGCQTKTWRITRRMWAAYGPAPLRVMTPGSGKTIEVIVPGEPLKRKAPRRRKTLAKVRKKP